MSTAPRARSAGGHTSNTHGASEKTSLKFLVHDRVLSDACTLTATERIVLLALAKHINNKTGICFPAISTISKVTAVSARSVQRAIKVLAAHPERSGVRVEVKPWLSRSGGCSSNRYVLGIVDELATQPASTPVLPDDERPQGVTAAMPRANESDGSARVTPGLRLVDTGPTPGRRTNSGSDSGKDNNNNQQPPPQHQEEGAGIDSGIKPEESELRRGSEPASDLSDVNRILEVYREEYERARGSPPPITSSDRVAAARLLAAVQGKRTRALQTIRAAYADTFWQEKASLQTIARDPARFAAGWSYAYGDDSESPNDCRQSGDNPESRAASNLASDLATEQTEVDVDELPF